MGNLQVRFLEGWAPAMAPGYSTLIPLCQSWPSFGRSWAGMWDARPQHCRRSGYSSVDIEVPTNNEVSRITGEHIVEQLFA
jgi:hypothetical protein